MKLSASIANDNDFEGYDSFAMTISSIILPLHLNTGDNIDITIQGNKSNLQSSEIWYIYM